MSRNSAAAFGASFALMLAVACSQTPSQSVEPAAPPSSARTSATAPQVEVEPQGALKQGGTVTEAIFGDAVTFQKLLSSDSQSTAYQQMIYAPLMSFDPALNLVGDLAESYRFSEDKKSITFTLRPNIAWSDGTPITSADARFTWEKMMDPSVQYPYRSLQESLFSDVAAPDARTVVFNLKGLCGPALLTAAGFTPIPSHVFQDLDINNNPHNMKPPVSSAPWTLKEWVKDDHATFDANDRYWKGRPNLDTYTFQVVQDQTVAYTRFRNREADSTNIDVPQYDEATRLNHAEVFRYYTVGANWDYISFNLRDPRFSDLRVRQAFSHAVNRDQMIETIRQGFSKPQFSIYPVTSPVFTDQVAKYDFDQAHARELLGEAGWKPGRDGMLEKDGEPFEVRLFFNSGNKRREAIATRTQEYLRQVGVKANIVQEEWATILNRVNKTHDFDMVVLGWVGSPDPNGQSNIWKKGSAQNSIGYENPEVERLFELGATECEMEKRKAHYQQVQNILAQDAPYIFLWSNEVMSGVNKRVHGAHPGPLDLRWNVEEWFVD